MWQTSMSLLHFSEICGMTLTVVTHHYIGLLLLNRRAMFEPTCHYIYRVSSFVHSFKKYIGSLSQDLYTLTIGVAVGNANSGSET